MPLDRLRQIMKTLNLRDVSRGSGVHVNTLYRIANGGGAQYDTVQRILSYLQTQGIRVNG